MARPYRSTVLYDPDALQDFLAEVKSREERKAAYNAVDKLRRVGSALGPPYMKPLQGESYVVLAVAKHKQDFETKKRLAGARAGQYDGAPWI